MHPKLATLLALAVALSGCNLYQQHEAEGKVRAQLRDPESAQFSEVTSAGNGMLVCGMVNAKNGMGGYVGRRKFVVWGDSDVAVAQDEIENIRFDTCCMILTSAVENRRASKDIPDFARACAGVVEKQFSW